MGRVFPVDRLHRVLVSRQVSDRISQFPSLATSRNWSSLGGLAFSVELELIFEVSSLSHNVTAHHLVGTSYSAVVRRCILEVLEAAVRKSGSGMREDPLASWCCGIEIA
jgi:hypothetical protein